jgi:enoyl-CoA hydratase/carnithine racemase
MSNSPSKATDHMASTGFSLDRSTPSLWRVTFNNPPINLIDPAMIVALHDLLAEIERDNRVAVVVFASADADFFLAHYDIAADQSAFKALPAARTPFHHWANLLIRLSRSRAVTISAIRGRARGAGSEFVLATDVRFASRERAVLGQFEVGFAAVPGGGPLTRLPGMVGRGRAFEILLGGEDFDGGLAERYGYVNRSVPDAEFVGFVKPSRSGSRASICSRWPTSSASSTLHRFPPLPLSPPKWTLSRRPSPAQPRPPSSGRRSRTVSSSAATSN